MHRLAPSPSPLPPLKNKPSGLADRHSNVLSGCRVPLQCPLGRHQPMSRERVVSAIQAFQPPTCDTAGSRIRVTGAKHSRLLSPTPCVYKVLGKSGAATILPKLLLARSRHWSTKQHMATAISPKDPCSSFWVSFGGEQRSWYAVVAATWPCREEMPLAPRKSMSNSFCTPLPHHIENAGRMPLCRPFDLKRDCQHTPAC
jgi:hypothetical protein